MPPCWENFFQRLYNQVKLDAFIVCCSAFSLKLKLLECNCCSSSFCSEHCAWPRCEPAETMVCEELFSCQCFPLVNNLSCCGKMGSKALGNGCITLSGMMGWKICWWLPLLRDTRMLHTDKKNTFLRNMHT